jgi:hypothetical protein
MARTVSFPIVQVNNVSWAKLSVYAPSNTHIVCAENFKQQKDISFAGGHRVRVYGLKNNIHWRVPEGIDLDISNVGVPAAPRRRQGQH